MNEQKPKKFKKLIFAFSIILNVVFILFWFLNYLNSPTYKLGILTRDVNAGFLAGKNTIYKIPKGITVRDVSPRGIAAIGQFENNRFEIVITTESDDLVNYDISKDSIFEFGNYYSADKTPGEAR